MGEHVTSLAPLAALGVFHGVNPGMGWLFAVALGMQERRRLAVWRALLPLGAGHVLAVGLVTGLAALTGLVVPMAVLEWTVASLLVALGIRRLIRHRHPAFGGMRVGMAGLTIWSCLMATAHGAGLMVLPFVVGGHISADGVACHAPPGAADALAATAIHGAGYLAATAALAVLVFETCGVGLLRRAWLNLDLVWAIALIVAGVLTIAW